jgi:hypothetical protein
MSLNPLFGCCSGCSAFPAAQPKEPNIIKNPATVNPKKISLQNWPKRSLKFLTMPQTQKNADKPQPRRENNSVEASNAADKTCPATTERGSSCNVESSASPLPFLQKAFFLSPEVKPKIARKPSLAKDRIQFSYNNSENP